MKGIVFNLFDRFVREKLGDEAFERVLESTTLVTLEPFVGPGNYPDSDLLALVATTCRHHDIAPAAALRAFGHFSFRHLAAAVPQFVTTHVHPKPFLKTLGPLIHVEVKKLYPSARPPDLEAIDTGVDKLRLIYVSQRRMGELAFGLLEGVRDHFGVPFGIVVAEKGADDTRWVFDLEFTAEHDGA